MVLYTSGLFITMEDPFIQFSFLQEQFDYFTILVIVSFLLYR